VFEVLPTTFGGGKNVNNTTFLNGFGYNTFLPHRFEEGEEKKKF
jgi:hypothetical protein